MNCIFVQIAELLELQYIHITVMRKLVGYHRHAKFNNIYDFIIHSSVWYIYMWNKYVDYFRLGSWA